MPGEKILGPSGKETYFQHIEKIIAGRSADEMKRDVARALSEIHHDLTEENAQALVEAVKPRDISKGGSRTQKVPEILAIIEVALELRKNSPEEPQRLPYLNELAAQIRMDRVDLDSLLWSKSVPTELRWRTITRDPKFLPKKKR
jgi:hypothetical protein